MSVCDPYREVELFCEQAQNEISQVFEPANEENSPKQPAESHAYRQQEQNESHPNGISIAEWETVQVFSLIAADLNEMITRYKLSQSSNENGFAHKINNDPYRIIRDRMDENVPINGSLTNTKETNGVHHISDDVLIKELSASQSTLNSTDNVGIAENQIIINACTQTSPSPSHSSTNLTWASDSCSSPYLTSPSDHDCLDEDSSSSSVDGGAHGSLTHGPTWCQKPELSAKSSSAPVLKKEPAKVNKQARSQSDRHLSEIEAAEACKWLRAAGFPQYAQMYEDMQFPVDDAAAQLDHPHLEPAVLHSLYRRLQTLNNCARIHQQRVTHTDDSEDEQCALSDNWTYQSDLGRWSRNCQNMQIPNIEEATNKEGWRGSLRRPKDVIDRLCESPKDKLRRAGSTKFRRRGVVVVEGSNETRELDNLSKQLHDLNASDAPSSDSELTPRHSRRRKTKSLDKNDFCADPTAQQERVIWQPLPKEDDIAEETRLSLEEGGRAISTLSSNQLQILRKLALLKLTAHMEKYCPSHRTGWNWDLPKFIRKMKSPIYKEKRIFGVPITITLQKTGLPLPKCIEEALEWLSQNASDQVGLFRKSGVRSRIQTLRTLMETKGETLNFNDHQAYDVADTVKQYFRELPEALFTNKLSETFFLIFQHVPEVLHREAVLCALLLMPDEHCEVLQALLHFLWSIAKKSETNQMNESNLAVCFAPSLFHYSQVPSNRQGLGSPHPRELAENKAAHDCLLYLLNNHTNIFSIPKELLNQCKSGEMKECSVVQLAELGAENNGDWRTYLHECQEALLREVREKGRGWMPVHTYFNKIEVSYKKVIDGHPLRLWKICADIEAPPAEVLFRILRERHIWDEDLHSSRIIYQIDKHAEIFQYTRRNINPLPLEDYCIVRSWKTDLPKGACLIVETSVEHPDAYNIPNSVRSIVLASRYFIEPCGSGRSRLLHLSRVDTRGRMPEWYHKNFGHICALHVSNVLASFKQNASGPESKV